MRHSLMICAILLAVLPVGCSNDDDGGTGPGGPILNVSPDSLHFGMTETVRSLAVQNAGTGTLYWEVLEPGGWLSVDPTNGETTSEADTVTVTVDRSGLNPGNYLGRVTVLRGDEDARHVAVSMSVGVSR